MTEERDDEQAVREDTTAMAREGDRMEERLEDLEDDIETARKTAAQRQDAPDDEVVAGDWEGQASGADHGDDATDSGRL